ncbi:MAG: glycine cleavage system protein GcvH [Myxococcota bacterium]|nr:glycine cleavage system protein GcvH [Myxococcota bacterium]
MSEIPNDRVYTEEHEWVQADPQDGTLLAVGITDYAQEALGDIVMVELPEVGDAMDHHQVLGALESPKSVSDVFCPVAGEIAAINEDLEDAPETVNDDPYGDGWLVKVRVADASVTAGLMSADAYGTFLKSQEDD